MCSCIECLVFGPHWSPQEELQRTLKNVPELILSQLHHKLGDILTCQFRVASCQLIFVSCELISVSCELSVDICQLRVDICQLRVASCELQADHCSAGGPQPEQG